MFAEIIKTIMQVDRDFYDSASEDQIQAVFNKAEEAYWATSNLIAWYVELPMLVKTAIMIVRK